MGRVGGGATFQVYTDEERLEALTLPVVERFVIGVLDTGVVLFDGAPHSYLAGCLAGGGKDSQDILPEELGPLDGHGTFVAGLIHEQAPAATIDMRNALDATGDNDAKVAEAIVALSRVEHLQLVNLSFFGEDTRPPAAIHDALVTLFDAKPEVLVVNAAGNRWTEEPVWPGAYASEFDRLVVVGAVDGTVVPVPGRPQPRASFSNYGPQVNTWAPGVGLLGPTVSPVDRRETWARWSGTSFAAATVTGRIAQRMLSTGAGASEAWTAIRLRKNCA